MPSLREWLKDPKFLLLISVALNAVFVAIIARDGDTSITTPYFTLSLAKFDLNDHVNALFTKGTDLPQVRALLEEKHFYEIGPDNPGAEPIAQALADLADSHFAHALVARLRDMSRNERGPFKGAKHQARIVAKNDQDGMSEGTAQVCSDSDFGDMYLTIWSNDRGTTVHAAAEKECPPLSQDLVELHAQDWNKVFGKSGSPRVEPVLVRLHAPRVTPPPAHPRQVAHANALPH
jgi:hypothetical protein